MAYHCFFATALSPSKPAEHIPIPPQTSLVVAQVCVADECTYRGRISLVVEGPKKVPLTLATLHPDKGVLHAPLQVIFTNSPKFALVVNRADVLNPKNHRGVEGGSAPSPADLEAACVVHITGYYEREADRFDDDEEEEEEGDMDDDDDES